MKKLILFVAFLGAFGVASINAQSCMHDKASCTKTAASCTDAAAKAAEGDASIEKRTNPAGEVTYVRKVSNENGSITFQDVEYDAAVGKFVNVAPAGKMSCGKEGPACCAKGAGAGCCAKKGAGTASAGTAEVETKQAPAAKAGEKIVKAAPSAKE